MKIEILYPEFCNLNGDMGNMKYLKRCLPEAEVIETAIDQEPSFLSQEDIALVYMGTLSERSQEIVIKKLMPYKEAVKQKIEAGQLFLFTGNSVEVLGNYIENEDRSKIEALGIFNVYAKRDMLHRHNSFFLGTYEDIEILGFKSQFTMLYGDNSNNYLAEVQMGIGINPETKLEGIHQNNFIATYVIGPLLILNPYFTLKLLKMMGVDKPKLAFEEEVLKAYEVRLKKFKTLEAK
ncbi:MAG: hypothetical protein ACLR6T_09570 [Intestinibacter sp.]